MGVDARIDKRLQKMRMLPNDYKLAISWEDAGDSTLEKFGFCLRLLKGESGFHFLPTENLVFSNKHTTEILQQILEFLIEKEKRRKKMLEDLVKPMIRLKWRNLLRVAKFCQMQVLLKTLKHRLVAVT